MSRVMLPQTCDLELPRPWGGDELPISLEIPPLKGEGEQDLNIIFVILNQGKDLTLL